MFGILIMIIHVLFPILIGIIYSKKIKSLPVKPDVHDLMSIEQLQDIYGTLDVDLINRTVQMKTAHNTFMNRYGGLLNGVSLERISRKVAISTPIVYILRKLVVSVSLIYLGDQPALQIILLVKLSLAMLAFNLHARPFDE